MIEALITSIRIEAEDIISLELTSLAGTSLPQFTAGSHIDLHLPGPLIRQYSLWNDPEESHRYCIGVLKDPESRGGSKAVHELLQAGQQVSISEPRNLFKLDESAQKSLLFAGGIGITPILSMAQRLHAIGSDFELHYCSRSRNRAAFIELIEKSPFANKVHYHFDDEPEHQRLDVRQLLTAPTPSKHLYVCGPGGFMAHVLHTAKELGWDEGTLHREYFAVEPATVNEQEAAFEVKIASSGRVFTVPAGVSVVQVLENAGITVPVSCEQGICGTCLTKVLEGVPEHRDLFMTEDEHALNDRFTPCCSRSKTARLVLDL